MAQSNANLLTIFYNNKTLNFRLDHLLAKRLRKKT
jgi:hypothetical protein